ncbi:MAG: translocation/assembly module TamB domain-containing protein [Candidatus Riflebacteria bacterium]|nr:translocation/assembly module TamB domain-containing protein [Candidatus Riflebacteria bacterium]
MRLSTRYMRLFYGLCVFLGLLGVGLAYAHRFIAMRIETALRELGEGSGRVAAVTGNLLEGMVLHELEFVSRVPGRTAVRVALPTVRVRYDLLPMLFTRRRLAPTQLEVKDAVLEVERRGAEIELHRLVPLFRLLKQELPGVPVTLDKGTLVLSGDFPWKKAQTLALDDVFLEWSAIGLAGRAQVGWQSARATVQGNYDPESGVGHWRWEGQRDFRGEDPAALAAGVGLDLAAGVDRTAPTSTPTASAAAGEAGTSVARPASEPRAWAGTRLTGRVGGRGNWTVRTHEPDPKDRSREWSRLDLSNLPPLYVSSDAEALVEGATVTGPSWPGPVEVLRATAAWRTGSPIELLATVSALSGQASLEGKFVPGQAWPSLTVRFDRVRAARVPALARLGPAATASGRVELSGPGPWPFTVEVDHLELPVPGDGQCQLRGQASPGLVRLESATVRCGKASATGTGELSLLAGVFWAKAGVQDLPIEWLSLVAPVKGLSGEGMRGELELRGTAWPPVLTEGTFALQAKNVKVAGLAAGNLRAAGRLAAGRLRLDVLEGSGPAALYQTLRVSGLFETGRHPDLVAKVQGLRLEAFEPAVRGLADADVKVQGGVHEVHARIRDLVVAALDLKVPQVGVELVPRGAAGDLTLTLPGRGRLEAAVVWDPQGRKAATATGKFNLPDVAFLLAQGGFLRGGKAAGTFRARLASGQPPEVEFRITELALTTQRGPLVGLGPVAGVLREGHLVFQRSTIRLAGGTVTFEGVAGPADSGWDFKLSMADLPVHFDTIGGTTLSGRLLGTLQLSGSLVRPTVVAALRLTRPNLGGVPSPRAGKGAARLLDEIAGRMSYRNGLLSVDKLTLVQGKQDCSISGRIPIQLSLSPFAVSWGEAPMDLRLVFPPTPLSVASLFVSWLPLAGDGTFQADVSISGTPAAPRVQGLLAATARKVPLGSTGLTATGVEMTVVFTRDRAELRKLTGKLAGGKLTGSGAVTLTDKLQTRWDVALGLDGVRVGHRYLTMEALKVSMHVGGAPSRLELDTSFTFDKGILDLALFDGPSSESFFAAMPDSVHYKIRGEAKGNFLVRSDAVNAELEGALVMNGQGPGYTLGGELNAVRGHLYFQGHRFAVESGTVSYRTPPAEDLFPWQTPLEASRRRPASVPYISVRGARDIGRTKVYVEVNGPVEHMSFALRSLPAHTQEEILAMLATGSDTMVAGAPGDTVVGRMVAAPLSARFDEQFLNRPVGAAVRRAMGLDEFRIDTNLIRTGTDRKEQLTPQISAGKYISKNVFVSVDGRVGSEKGSLDHLGVQYNVEKNLSITLDKNLETKSLGEELMRDLRPDETKVGMEYKLRW